MRSPSKILAIAVFTVTCSITALGGCGGASDSAPGPLGKRFDDMYIAAVPLDQKQSVVQSQNDWSLAKMQNAKAEADLNESTTQISIVRNEQKASKLAVESAIANKKAAEASADTNRMNQAAKDLHNAEALSKAAEARVKYYDAYRGYLTRVLRHTQENMYWREAQYESAKAQLGQKNGIAPKGVAYDSFPKQEQERAKREASARSRVESERSRAMTARDSWRRAQDSADRDSGRPSSLPDPMATSGATSSSS
ncbi:MAG: hypothetical protein H7138_13145 [Myxococcales bacterium]|nr:hypothetical protein [Myxococcales bacterium]